MSNYETILYEKQRHGVLITLNRPNALNAMNQDLLGELDQALAEAETDPDIRAVVLNGAGPPALPLGISQADHWRCERLVLGGCFMVSSHLSCDYRGG